MKMLVGAKSILNIPYAHIAKVMVFVKTMLVPTNTNVKTMTPLHLDFDRELVVAHPNNPMVANLELIVF